MRCKTCNYRLWNLRSRRCPECGTPFLPSEFEFTLNSVQFCCPHCNQPYYGTGEHGHLVPSEFDCVSCGTHIHMDEMVLLPTEGIKEEHTETDHMPWLERKHRGVMRGWLATVGRALSSPGRLMRSTPVDSSMVQAWWFAILTNTLAMLVGAVPFVVFPAVIVGSFGGARIGLPVRLLLVLGIGLVCAVMLTTVVMAIWGAVTHGILCLTGRTAAPIRRTYQAICYSAGANVPMGIPCVGIYFGWIWYLVSAVIMVKEAQKVHGGRAALATLTGPLSIVATVIGLYVWMFFVYIPSVSRGPAGGWPTTASAASGTTQVVLNGVLDYAQANGGSGPSHAVELVTDAALSTSDFIAPGSATVTERVPLGGSSLGRFDGLSRPEERGVVAAAVKALPKNTVAHRLGDFVFTYHGMDLGKAQSGLWVVVLWPDPEVNPGGPPNGVFSVGRADRSVTWFPVSDLPRRLAEQNRLRAEAHLPPLPAPATVTHAKPAVGEP